MTALCSLLELSTQQVKILSLDTDKDARFCCAL